MRNFKAEYDEAAKQLTGQPGSAFELGNREIDGVKYRVFINAPATIPELIAPARQNGDADFLVYEGERTSFAKLFAQADQLAFLLQKKYGVKKGDRVAIAMRNYPEWMAAWLAIVAVGAIVVPVNSLGGAQELQFNLQDCGAKLVFCDQRRYELIDFATLPVQAIVARPTVDDFAKGCTSLDALLGEAPPAEQLPAPGVSIDTDDTAMIMYTSGTSGRPKGAVFTHFNVCQAIINLEFVGAAAYMTNQDLFNRHFAKQIPIKSLLTVPLFHVSGLYSQFLPSLRGGRALVMMYKWDLGTACTLIESERIANVVGAPSMLLDLLEFDRFTDIDASSVMNISGGGAASPERLSLLRREKTPDAMGGAGWGMTETGGAGASFTGAVALDKPLASGFVHPIVDLKFCDESGSEVPGGEPGEIWIKSPTNVRSYWNRPEANDSEFRDGWFKSGDIGYIADDGCLYICDRAKDMVIRKGENIYPAEIENCITSMPGVEQCTAFAVPSESMGEELAVVVRRKPGAAGDAIDEAAVQEFCAGELAAFKVPSFVKFSEQPFPVNATNKVLKKQVRAQFFPDA